MPVIVLDDCEIHYELIGEGPTLVLTPGGRLGGDAVRHLVEPLARAYRVMLWDRRNTGRSSLWFGEEPEQLVWADDLAAILRELDLAPAFLAGASAGARVSYLAAIRHPEVVAGLALWSLSGGPYASQVLGYVYHTPYIDSAIQGGMAAVAQTPFFRERVDANPANRTRLLSTPPATFIAALRNWNASFYYQPDSPVMAATANDLRSITCPALVFEGNDDVHTSEAARAFHALVRGSRLLPSPWSTEEWIDHLVGRAPGTVMALYPRVVPAMLDFLTESLATMPERSLQRGETHET
jgi:pimeloyl-ACP methyl ester carboxylesterase